jgi:hypothetical protein
VKKKIAGVFKSALAFLLKSVYAETLCLLKSYSSGNVVYAAPLRENILYFFGPLRFLRQTSLVSSVKKTLNVNALNVYFL